MVVVVADRPSSSVTTIAEHMIMRRPRNEFSISEPDPAPAPRCKSTISSLILSSSNESKKKTNNFTQSTLRGLGCTAAASQQVSVPEAIRTSADWETKKVKKKKAKQERKKKESLKFGNGKDYARSSQGLVLDESNSGMSSGLIQDVWCGPGIGFSSDAVGSVDCVVARRNVHGRGKIDGDKINHREPRRGGLNFEAYPLLDSDHPIISTRPQLDFFGTGTTRYSRHVRRHPSPEGLAEIMLLQNKLIMGGRVDSSDRFIDWRLDIEDMTYEELLELGDRIGYVNTGLKEDEISRCLRKTKNSVRGSDRNCSVCQEEYEAHDQLAKLKCGHSFHIQCIKLWLAQKNCCPVCKTAAMARS